MGYWWMDTQRDATSLVSTRSHVFVWNTVFIKVTNVKFVIVRDQTLANMENVS